MIKLLCNLYYDGYTLSEAIIFIKRCYNEIPQDKDISEAKKIIKACNNIDWL